MLVLFELISTLTKEEKRLYHLHGQTGKIRKIYDAYKVAPYYDKKLDQEIYSKHFTAVSRAFYSMQKRSLIEDIVYVLLYYSNSKNPVYEFNRNYLAGSLLLSRGLGDAAFSFFDDARKISTDNNFSKRGIQAIDAQLNALVLGEQRSFNIYENLVAEREALLLENNLPEKLREIYLGLVLLSLNVDREFYSIVKQKADEHMAALHTLLNNNVNSKDLIFQRMECEMLHADITGTTEENHKKILESYNSNSANGKKRSAHSEQKMLNLLLRSALKCGDFLTLSGKIYKTNKDIEATPNKYSSEFLVPYYEICSLFHFYENDIPLALKEIDYVLSAQGISKEVYYRCIFYRLAMLIAAHLPDQAKKELKQYCTKFPEIENTALIAVIDIVLSIDQHKNANDVLLDIQKYKNKFRRKKEHKACMDNLKILEAYLEKKVPRAKHCDIFPSDWENILQIEQWLQAKKTKKFYFNLLVQDWQNRKKVF